LFNVRTDNVELFTAARLYHVLRATCL